MTGTTGATKRKLVLVPFSLTAVMLTLAVSVYACTNYVGVLRVWGSTSGGCTTGTPNTCANGSAVAVTGNDTWNGPGPMTQTVNPTISSALHTTGTFWVAADVSGSNTLNQGSSNIWYDVNTIPVGYTNHLTWGGTNAYDCMSWQLNTNGVLNHGSVQINTSGNIIAAMTGPQGTGTSMTLFISGTTRNVAGPFTVSANEATNNFPQESGVCLSDGTSTNGNQAPLTIT